MPQQLLSEHFDPDIYQSEGAAVRGLTSQVAKLLDSVTPDHLDPGEIVIKGKIGPTLIQEMTTALRKDFPTANIFWSKMPTRVNDDTVIVYVCREPQSRPATSQGAEAAAPARHDVATTGPASDSTFTLRMDVTGRQAKISRSVQFIDKPWVDDFAAFASRSRGRSWIMALSRELATGAGEAEEQAISDAIRQLEPRIRSRMSTPARDSSSAQLKPQIRSGLETSGTIVDRFVQRFDRPYGDIWQVGLLIDASSRKIGGIAGKCDRVVAVKQRSFRQTVLSIAGVVALACVVYVILNTVTRGYFVWSLRAAALAVIAGGVFLVLLLSHNEPVIEGFLR